MTNYKQQYWSQKMATKSVAASRDTLWTLAVTNSSWYCSQEASGIRMSSAHSVSLSRVWIDIES